MNSWRFQADVGHLDLRESAIPVSIFEAAHQNGRKPESAPDARSGDEYIRRTGSAFCGSFESILPGSLVRSTLLNLILETKGYRGGDAQVKTETMKTLWVLGVNNLSTFGRWHFEEFTDVFEIEAAFGNLVDGLLEGLSA